MDCSRDVDGDGGDGNKNNKLLAWILCAILGRGVPTLQHPQQRNMALVERKDRQQK